MKKKNQEKGPRKLQLHRETVHTLLVSGGDPMSVTCYTCPDQTTVTQGCAACTNASG